MANAGQIKMLMALAKEAGQEKVNWEQFADLDNSQIDEKVKQYEALGAVKKSGNGNGNSKTGINYERFGMCCKIVARHKSVAWCIGDRDKFADDIASLYISVEHAERRLKERLPVGKITVAE